MPATTDSRTYDKLLSEYNGTHPIKILAEGDSWFAYPRSFFMFGKDANIIDHLADHSNLFIYNSSSNGDEAVAMASGAQKLSLLKRLAHNEFDYLFFSGGGNDIVGRYDFDFFLKKKEGDMLWLDCIKQERVAMKLDQIKRSYEIICEIVKEYSLNKNIKIVTHTYDYVTPKGTGFELFDIIPMGDSWVYPYLIEKNIIEISDQKNIINHLLVKFKNCLNEVAEKYEYLKVVDTQGLLNDSQWRNEIHPDSEGFGIIANKIYEEGIVQN